MNTPLLLLYIFLVSAATAQYEDHLVVRAYLDERQIEEIHPWNLDVWSGDSSLLVGPNDIVVSLDHLEQLQLMQVSYDILIPDLQIHMAVAEHDLELSRSMSNAMMADFFLAYHTYDEIQQYLVNLTNAFPAISKYVGSIGTTVEGRHIPAVSITGTATGTKKNIFVSGGQHAREWIAPATTLYIITQLITLYQSDSTVKALLDSTQFYFVPLVNVDGYVFTWTGSNNRLWRKNRSLNHDGSRGVDLNRNWDDHWGTVGTSHTPRDDTYCGTAAFSEPESKAVSQYALKNAPIVGAIDYHSYSQLVLRPYGWTTTVPPDDAFAKTVGDGYAQRILATSGLQYTSQGAWQLYYTSGTARDWYNSKAASPVSYTVELRDTGTYGFQLPANQIKPTGAENWAAFIYFAQTAK
jgi:murein tripeptide amidase MpaA